MNRKQTSPAMAIVLALIAAMLLSACGGTPTTSTPALATPTSVPPTKTPVPATPTATPTPEYILFVVKIGNKPDIFKMFADGSGLTNLTENDAWDHQPTWSIKNQQIVFISDRDDDDSDIYSMNLDGSDVKRLTNFTDLIASDPTWSPDETKIAFKLVHRGGDYDIYVMDSDGQNQRKVMEGLNHDGTESLWVITPGKFPTWSPDGKKLLTVSGSDPGGSFDIYTVDVESGELVQLTDSPTSDWIASWSPDGQKIAFYSKGTNDSLDLFVMNADGSGQKRIAAGVPNDYFPHLANPLWSGNNKNIVFASFQDDQFDLYMVGLDGNNLIRITETPGLDENPVWASNETKLVFTSRPENNVFEIFTINVDGSNLIQLTELNDASFPVWISSQ